MNAKFHDIHAAADYIGPGAIEVPIYQTEITDIVRAGAYSVNVSSRCLRLGTPRDSLKRPQFPRQPQQQVLSIHGISLLRW